MRLELHDVPDKIGNLFSKTGSPGENWKWEFYVDRNELAWLTDSVGTTKYDDESKVLSTSISGFGSIDHDYPGGE